LGLNTYTIKTEAAWQFIVKFSNNKSHIHHFSNSQAFTGTEISRWMTRKILIGTGKDVNAPNNKPVTALCILIFGF
jgi:hypothetical protein